MTVPGCHQDYTFRGVNFASTQAAGRDVPWGSAQSTQSKARCFLPHCPQLHIRSLLSLAAFWEPSTPNLLSTKQNDHHIPMGAAATSLCLQHQKLPLLNNRAVMSSELCVQTAQSHRVLIRSRPPVLEQHSSFARCQLDSSALSLAHRSPSHALCQLGRW